MESFLIPLGIVALAEMGDKTQLLTLVLTTRFQQPWPIALGIFTATLANHGAAGALGQWITSLFPPATLRLIVGGFFLVMAAWILVPDKEGGAPSSPVRWGVWGTTFILFFLAEMGDKTQLATIALAARYQNLLWVVLGTTFGMMVANVPAIILGARITRIVPLRMVHSLGAALFALLGFATILNVGHPLG